jgi:hypothetical protein
VFVQQQESTRQPKVGEELFSDFSDEAEVLFMIGSIFRVQTIHRDDDQLWILFVSFFSFHLWCTYTSFTPPGYISGI